MFERKATGIALEADGTVRVVELTATVRTMTLARMQTFAGEGDDQFSSWQDGIGRARESGFEVENAVVGITDSMTYRKQFHFPFRSRKRIVQILESELEGEIPVPADSVVADFLPGVRVEKGIEGVAIACSRQTMTRVLELFGGGTRLRGVQTLSSGLAAACHISGFTEGIAVLAGGSEAILVKITSGSLVAVRRLAVEIDPGSDMQRIVQGIIDMAGEDEDVVLACRAEIASMIEDAPGMEGLAVRRFSALTVPGLTSEAEGEIADYAAGFGLALRGLGRKESSTLDLRQGPFGQITPLANLKRPVKRTASIGLIVLLILTVNLVVNTGKVKGEYERYLKLLETEFVENFPDVPYRRNTEVEVVEQRLKNMQERMNDLSGFDGTGVLTVLARLSSAIPADITMKIDELSYDSKKLRVEGTVSSFDAVDKVKSALDEESFFSEVQVQNARIGADVNRINFRLQMEVR